MRTDAALEHRVAIDRQMVGRDGRRQIWPAGLDERHRFGRGDMFEHHFERRKIGDQLAKNTLNKDSLSVKYVDMALGNLAMDQQRHADPLHRLKHIVDLGDVGDAMIGVGGGVRRIELAGREHALGETALNFAWVDGVSEVAGHQRLEGQPWLKSGQDAASISLCSSDGRDWRAQIWHDNGARELPGRVVDDGGEHGAVAKVDMPIIGPSERQAL